MSEAEGSGIYDAEYSDSDSDNESETDLSEESDSDSSDGSDIEEEDEDDITEESQIVDVQEAEGISSDEGGEKESCPICLNRFIGQDLGIPESCDHIFCLECIREWSKNINTCPIDRTEFNYVNLKSTPNGKILKKIKVKVRPKEPENALQQEVTLCEVCHLGNREDRLLLCDACDLAYHCECLDPPLFRVPIEEWFCPPCSGILRNGAVAGPSVPRSRRVIPRTRASENVRTRVEDRRTRPAISRSPSNARKRAPQKRKRRAYRRGYKKVVTLARTKKNLMDGSKGKDCPRTTAVIVTYRRRRRRRKRRRVATKSTSARKSGAKKRISKHLGLVKSSKGGSIPDVKSKSKSTSKSVIPTGSSHYLFGDKNQLMDFSESYDENAPGPSRRQQEVVTPQPSSSSINILDSIMAGQKILHTKSNDVIIKTDGSLVLKENKIKEKGTFKKPLVPDKAKDKDPVRKPNVSEKSNEKEKGAIKKSSFGNKTKGIIKKPEVSNKGKSSHVKFGEPSDLGAIPKAEKHSERKPSPMLLAALSRRRENEMSNQSVSDYESNSSSSIEGIATSVDNHQQTNIDRQNFSKQPLLSLKSKISKSSSSYESVNKSSNYSYESSFKKSARANPIKSDFDDFQNSGLSDSSSDCLSFSCNEPNSSRVKYEKDNKRSLFKCENTKESPKHSFLSPKQEFNNVSRLHDVAFSTSFESTGSARQSCIKNENMSSNGRAKKSKIQKYIKKEETDILSEKSTLARNSTNATMPLYSETEVNSDEEDTMEFPSQSLIPDNFDALLTSFSDAKQLSFNVKKEPDSLSEKSDSECSQSLVEPLHKQLESNSKSLKKSLTNKVSNLKLKIKKELESSDDDCQSPNGESNRSFNKSHRQTINAIMDDDDTVGFEDSQSIITQTVAETADKTGEMHRQRFKGEINSSDDETNIHHISKSYSQSKSTNNLKNNKNVSKDFSKIKIKEEPPSSEDEGGESCSLLTDDLPFTQLVERNNLPYTHPKNTTFNCTQAINSPLSEQMNDLPCTQLAEMTCDKKDKSLSFNKPQDDLPCTQAIEMFDELDDDLPCTQFVKPAPVNYLSEKEEGALPSTQLVGSSSIKSFSGEKEDALPCTQLAGPVSSIDMEDLPCTQFVLPAPIKDISVKEEDTLPATRPSSPLSQMETDDLPYTQLVEPLSNNPVSEEKEDALPCTQLARPVSRIEMEDLPCTQLAMPLSSIQIDDLPATQSVVPTSVKYSKRKVDPLPATQPTSSMSQIQTDDLPCTQAVEPSSKNSFSYEDDALPCTQLARPLSGMEREELPCTQLARPLSNMQMNDSPSTQFLMPAPVKYPRKRKVDSLPSTQPTSSLSQLQTDDLPCTQLVEPSSKNSFSYDEDALPCTQLMEPSSKNPVSNEEEDTLPCTQLAKPVSGREMEDLPCTQLARPLSNSQVNDLPSTQFAVPAPVKYPIKKKVAALPATQPSSTLSQTQMDDLPCTQLVEALVVKPLSDKEEDSLPCTQLASPMPNLHSRKVQNAHVQSKELPAFSGKQGNHTNVQTKQKQSDNFQKDKNCQENLPAPQQNTSIEHSGENSENLSNLNSNFDDDFDLPETQPLTFDQHHSSSEKLLQENCNDEKVTDEELLSNIDKLKIKKPPVRKVVGVHKNLPQVLMPILSRRFPIPKPSNRNTFSFNQVKQQCDTKDNKNSFKGSISFGRLLPDTKIGDLSTKGTQSSVLKKEQQISSEFKAENINNFKEEKSLFLNECGILVSSVPNCDDVEGKVDKSSAPADSEIEVIDDNKIMKIKKVEEFVLSSDEEDLPATQFFDRTTNQCSNLPNQRKLERVVVKKEITLDDFQVENVKAFNSLPVKQEKCEENISRKLKIEPLQQLKTEEKISRSIKIEKKSHNSEDTTIARNIQCADKCTNQKISSTKNIHHDNVSRSVRSHEKHVREHTSKTDPTDRNKKTVRDRSSSSDIKVEFEKESKRKTEGSSEMRIHPNAESRVKTKTENRQNSKTNNNSDIKLNTENPNQIKLVNKDKKAKTEHMSSSHTHANGEHMKHHKLVIEKPKSSSKEDSYHGDSKRQKHSSLDDSKKVQDHKNHNLVTEKPKSSSKEDYHEDSKRQKRDSLDDSKKVQDHKNHKLVTEKPKSSSKEDYHEDSKRRKHDSLDESKKVQDHKNHKLVAEKPKSSSKENYEDSKRQKRDSLDDSKKVQDHKNHKLVTEKYKSSKEDNYHEESKRRKHDSLDNSKTMQNHKKLKVDSLTVKKELSAYKSGKHDFEKSLDNKKEIHVLKNNIKIEDSVKQKSSQRSVETEQMSNSGKVKETHVSNSRNGNKAAKIYNKTFENQHSNKSPSEKNLKVAHSNSHDNKRNCEYVNSDSKSKEFGAIPFNDKERLNGGIKTEPDSEKKVKNQLKASKTNFKNESSRTGLVVKRSDSSEGERSTKRPRLESLSCNEDTSDCHSDYSRSSVISSESNFQKKYKHQRNALNSLNDIADEIISTSKNHNTDILNQDENMDLEVIKRSKDPSSLGRKVDKAHLKDEIAAEVKIALKPFYSVGLIDKEDYKDIMRKAVPKIYMNCGNYVHPEKIKNLVTGYVKKLTNS